MSASFTAAAAAALVALASNPLTIFALGMTVLGGIYLRFIKGTARQALVDSAIEKAFFVVEDMKAQGKLPTYANKPVEALEQLRVMLKAHGLTVTSGIEDLARATWSAMHAPANSVSTVTATAPAGFKATAEVEVDPGKPSARRMGFVGAALVAALLCLPQLGCIQGWTAAEKAAPACYGLNAASLTTLVSEGKTIATTTASGCATGAPTCIAAVEADVGTYLANKALDDQTFQCVVEAIKLEIAYPNGGEAAYVPDAGTGSPDAGAIVAADTRLPLERAVALTPVQTTALEALSNLAAQHHAATGGVR